METFSVDIKYLPIKRGSDVQEADEPRYLIDLGRKYRVPIPVGVAASKKPEYVRYFSRDYVLLRAYHLNKLTQKYIGETLRVPQQRISDVIQSSEPGVQVIKGFVDREIAQIVYMAGIGIPDEVIADIMDVNPANNPFPHRGYIMKDWRGITL